MQEHQPGHEFARHHDRRERDRLTEEANDRLRERGVRFGEGDGHPFRVDPVPRLVEAEEWEWLTAGLRQRLLALEGFLDDVYGEQRLLRDGVVPERIVAESPYFEQDLRGVRPRGGARVSVAGMDVVRDARGRLRVLEDNLRNPSGLAYAAAVSDAVADVLEVDEPPTDVQRTVPAALRRCLEAAAPDLEGELVLLTEGESSTASYEHERLAAAAELTVVTLEDLRRHGDHVRLGDGRRVRSVYCRTGEDRLRDDDGRFTREAELLLEPLRAGEVGLVNWFGNGVADDKLLYAYVDDLVLHLLGEEPILPSVPTYDLADPARLEAALDRLADLVVKPRAGYGGHGVVVGPVATPDDLRRAREAVRADPAAWIAQEVVSLSSHPTVVDGRLEPRHVDLRPFVFHDGHEVTVPRGGLTRVAMEAGEMVVNSSRDGGGKATWVV